MNKTIIIMATVFHLLSTCFIAANDDITEHYRQGKYQEALKLVDNWANIHTKFALLKTLGKYQDALDLWNKTSSRAYDIAILNEGIELHQLTGQSEEAAKLQKKVKFLVENDYNIYKPSHFVVCGKVLFENGTDPADILKNYYEKALKEDPTLKSAYIAAADLCFSKDDVAAAAKFLQRANKKIPNDPDILLGLARAFKDSDPQYFKELQAKINDINPQHCPTLKFNLFQALLTGDSPKAEELISQLQAINKYDPELLSIQACLQLSKGDTNAANSLRQQALKLYQNNPQVDLLMGQYLSYKGFFEQSNKHLRASLRFAPKNRQTRLELSLNFLRLGHTDQAFDIAQKLHKEDPYNITAFNLVQLNDVFKELTIIKNKYFTIRMSPLEAKIYGGEVERLLEKARLELNQKYGFEITEPVYIDFFENAEDFAIRNFAYPLEFGALGICFGNVVTIKSISAQNEPRNWQETLWHEYTHVVTLALSKKKVPRWLTEGISVYEEWHGPDEWGMTLTPQFKQRILAEGTIPIESLNKAFHSQDIMFAYFQSGLLVKYLVDTYGFKKLKAVLNNMATTAKPTDVLVKHFGDLTKLNQNFKEYAQNTAQNIARDADFSQPTGIKENDIDSITSFVAKKPHNLAALYLQASLLKPAKAAKVYQKIIQLYPEFTEENNAYLPLAKIYRQQKETEKEIGIREDFHKRNANNPQSLKRLIELHLQEKNWPAAKYYSQRLIAVNPITATAYQTLAKVAEHNKNKESAIQYFKTALLCKDLLNQADTHFSLARLLKDKDKKAAKRHLLKCLEEAPRFRQAYQLLDEFK